MNCPGSLHRVPFLHAHCGVNVRLSMDGLTAHRVKSYDHALVVLAAPMEEHLLYQVVVKELNGKYHGCLRIGVTSLPPETVSSWKSWTSKSNASGDTKMTIVLDILEDGRLCVCSGGEKTAVQGSHFDLTSLSEGESIGVAIVPPHGVRFSINGKEIQTPSLTPSPSPQTNTRPGRVFVDLYGPITAVEVLPVQSRESDCCLRLGSLPREVGVAGGIDCRYFELCRRFLHAQRATIADEYFNWSLCKCYCPQCYDSDSQPQTKVKGQPPESYAVPIGWAKFSLWVPKRAEVLKVFRDWHVCYHGTPVESVACILDCGQLMIRGDKTLPDHQPVPSPRGHFSDHLFRPEGYNTRQIFLSPSIHYCTHGEVYAESQRCVDSQLGGQYSAKVAFQLRVHPQACTVSAQTTQKTATRIDPCIPNDRLEWSTEYRSSTILTSLCIKITDL